MQAVDSHTLFSDDAEAIIDWLSDYQYPNEFWQIDAANSVVLYREGKLDLVVVNHYTKPGHKGVTAGVWLDFVGQQTDLRHLGRLFDKAHLPQYKDIWQKTALRVRQLGLHHGLPPIGFFIDQDDGKPHFRYV